MQISMLREENLCNLSVRLYRDGTGVVYRHQHKKNPEHKVIQHTKRKFSINKTKVRSATLATWAQKKSKHLLFITFTLPWDMTEDDSSKIWKLTLDSLRKTYNVNNYVWIKELQKIGRIHYHILIDRNRVGIKKLQTTFNTSIANITGRIPEFNNSVRLGRNPIVKNVQRLKGYLTKYISKEITEFDKRAYGYSEQLRIYKEVDLDVFLHGMSVNYYGEIVPNFVKGVKIIDYNDFFILFKIENYSDYT